MIDTSEAAETARLNALYRYDVLDTPQEESFDRITRLAASVMQTPIVLVSLIDRDRQWFKARQGLDATETARDISFCTHAIQNQGPMIVRDAREDTRFRDNPLVRGEPWIRFYLGVPLRTPDGYNIGTLCAIDREPRDAAPTQVALLQDLARLIVDELELRQIATTDSLTGALTRRGFAQHAEQAMLRAERYHHPISCIVLDVDYFKSVNDRHGHATGDAVLSAVAAACRSIIRSVDIFGRLGGEEFAVMLPETDLAGAMRTAERMRQAIADVAMPIDAGTLRVTASFGVTVLRDGSRDLVGLLHAADTALYGAKQAGRNRVIIAESARD